MYDRISKFDGVAEGSAHISNGISPHINISKRSEIWPFFSNAASGGFDHVEYCRRLKEI